MTLLILVPAPHELPLLGLCPRPAPTQRRFRWRPWGPWGPLQAESQHGGFARHGRFAEPTSQVIRDALFARWQRRCTAWARPPPPAPIAWRPRTSSDIHTLLRDAESVLHSLMRRRRRRLDLRHRRLTALARSFNAHRWRLKVQARQQEALVLLLCTRYWRGCRHPAALDSTPLHPPTALVRWLSRFPVQRQVDHGRQILEALVCEEARVHEFASELVRRMLREPGPPSKWVALLPDLLKSVEPP
jgi:hypothetical protein